MLPKIHRIGKELFKEIFPRGRSFHSAAVSVKISPIKEENIRFAFVVSAKTAKKAAVRNKLKRRARAIAAKLLPRCGKKTAVMVFFKKGSEKLSFNELEREITAILKKAGVLQ